jgi:hypothetical protein
MMCLTNEGKVSNNRRKQYQYTVPEAVFDYIEEVAQTVLVQQRPVAEVASAESDG